MFTGLDSEVTAIKSYLQEQDIKKTDKQLNNLISAKKWQERKHLVDLAHELMKIVGTDEYMDYNKFFGCIKTAASEFMEETSVPPR